MAIPEGTADDVSAAFAEADPSSSRSRTVVWQDPVPTAAAGATMSGLEYMTAVSEAEVPPPPIAVLMRYRPVEIEEGRVVFEGEPGEEHYNPIGVVHGGYAATMLDAAMGLATHTAIPIDCGYSTIDLNVTYLKSLRADSAPVTAEGRAIHVGRRLVACEAELKDRHGKLCARATATFMVIARGDSA